MDWERAAITIYFLLCLPRSDINIWGKHAKATGTICLMSRSEVVLYMLVQVCTGVYCTGVVVNDSNDVGWLYTHSHYRPLPFPFWSLFILTSSRCHHGHKVLNLVLWVFTGLWSFHGTHFSDWIFVKMGHQHGPLSWIWSDHAVCYIIFRWNLNMNHLSS